MFHSLITAKLAPPGSQSLPRCQPWPARKLAVEASTSGGAAQQIAAAVAVEIDGVLDVGRRHELGLADFAGPGAAHLRWRDIAALDDAQRIHQFGLEHVGAAAIVGQRRQRAHASGIFRC